MNLKAYRGCPCLLQENRKAFCLNEETLTEVVLIPAEGEVLLWEEQGICHNTVLAGEDGYVQCPSTRSHVKIKGKKISNEFFEEIYSLARLAFTDPSSCTQCLYNLLASDVAEKKVTILVLGENLNIDSYKKTLTDKLKSLIPENDFLIINGKTRTSNPQVILKKGKFMVSLPVASVYELERKISQFLEKINTTE